MLSHSKLHLKLSKGIVKHLNINRFDRSGMMQLGVESGRFNNMKLEDRICELCDDPKIEDEFCYLCVCQKYSNLRTTLFNSL